MNQMSIKLNYQGEFRRVTLPQASLSISELKDKAVQMYTSLKGQLFTFSWVDEDGDVIKFNSTEELQDAISFFRKGSNGVLKFSIETPQSPNIPKQSTSTKVVHENVTCDECGMKPIVGLRYKCAVRHDFDLCENCESKSPQPYPMVKIYNPDQAPLAILIAVKDEDVHRPFGRHGPNRGRGHFGHPHGRGPFGNPHGPHPRGPHPEGPYQCPPFKMGRCGRWAAKAFAEAMNAANESVSTAATAEATPLENNEDPNEIERRIIEDVLRMSVEEPVTTDSLTQSSEKEVNDSSVLGSLSSTATSMTTEDKAPASIKSNSSVNAGSQSANSVGVEEPKQTSSHVDLATDIWTRIYEVEIKLLRDMGFFDVSVIIPLLREHVKMPASRNPNGSGDAASTEAMQRVVMGLLSQSFTA